MLGDATGSFSRRVAIRHCVRLSRILLAILPALASAAKPAAPSDGVAYVVNSTSDEADAVIGDGVCETAPGNGVCTLRAAIEEANAQPTDDIINFDIPQTDPGYDGTSWTIGLLSSLPDLNTNLAIEGPGANLLIVTRVPVVGFRIFRFTGTGVVSLSGLSMTNGGAGAENGGAIINENGGTVNVTECAISGNSAERGGGISNQDTGTLNVVGCTISGNTAVRGGGITNQISGIVNVMNSTIYGNHGIDGGGIRKVGFGAVNVSNCTIVANTGRGMVNVVSGSFSVKSSIIGGNQLGNGSGDVSGAFQSQGFNLVSNADASTGFIQPTDQTGTKDRPLSLGLGGLNDNGGPTKTMQVLAYSRAIDKGSNEGLNGDLTTDQRGEDLLRTFDDPNVPNAAGGDGTDIGAFEAQAPLVTPTPGRLGNISTRVQVGTGDNVAIAGFIVAAASQKQVIIRALGPTLGSFGVDDALTDPTLQLYDSNGGLLETNDNWKDSNQTEIEATGLAPLDDAESAIVATLTTGAYTGIVGSASGKEGVGLVEVYELDQSSDNVLLNISTRGMVGTGSDVLIGGFIVLGDLPRSILVRAIGPSLPFEPGVFLADPTLELRDANGTTVATNDDWKESQEAEIQATGLSPQLAVESATLQVLSAGAYTAIVSGKDGTVGLALVEVYQL